MFPDRTPAFEAFIAPARLRPELWRLAAGFAMIVAIYVSFVIFTFITMENLGLSPQSDFDGVTPFGMVTILLTFAGVPLGVGVVTMTLHRRNISTIFAPDSRDFWSHFQIAASITFVLAAISLFLSLIYLSPEKNMPFGSWLFWLLAAVPLVFLQTASEEILFRGYLQQQLAARFQSRLIWWLLPSIAFGMLHYEPETYGENAWLVVASTTLFGLIAADVTARTGTLGAAIGIHFVNNVFALLFIGIQGDLTGLSLYVTPFVALDGERMRSYMMVDLVFIAALYYGYVRIMSRLGR